MVRFIMPLYTAKCKIHDHEALFITIQSCVSVIYVSKWEAVPFLFNVTFLASSSLDVYDSHFPWQIVRGHAVKLSSFHISFLSGLSEGTLKCFSV